MAVKFRPTSTCCGCLPLLIGVELICLLELLNCILLVIMASSKDELSFSGIQVSPGAQVAAATLGLFGIPVIIGAGVGALYRMESHLRLFCGYLALSIVILAFWCVYLMMNGKVCGSMVGEETQRLGTAFVCGFVDMASLFWMLMLLILRVYAMYIVWSAAEEVASSNYPELIKYSETLRSIRSPEEPSEKLLTGVNPASAYPFAAMAPDTPVIAAPVLPPIQTVTSYGALPQPASPLVVQAPVITSYAVAPPAQFPTPPVTQTYMSYAVPPPAQVSYAAPPPVIRSVTAPPPAQVSYAAPPLVMRSVTAPPPAQFAPLPPIQSVGPTLPPRYGSTTQVVGQQPTMSGVMVQGGSVTMTPGRPPAMPAGTVPVGMLPGRVLMPASEAELGYFSSHGEAQSFAPAPPSGYS